jgi:hypothetical protein
MAQIFHPRFGLFVRLALLASLVLLSAAVMAWRGLTSDPYRINETVEQPVPFSHRHHVGELGLDCRYCHSSVESDAFAGMPPVSTCMTCHSQLFTDQPALKPVLDSWTHGGTLRWNRVNNLPDFVYFNHAIHVAKGVGCESCHGRVDRMALMRRTQTLSMKWCLDCHRAPERQLRPREQEYAMGWHAPDQRTLGMALMQRYHIDRRRLTDCSVCHR